MAQQLDEATREQRRRERQKTRASQTYKEFLKYLMRISSLSEERAEEAAVSVLCVLERRLTSDESADLVAQLPRVLQQLVQRCERHDDIRPRDVDRKEFLRLVSEDLRCTPDEAEPVVRGVFQAIRAQVSEGEVQDVEAQLPGDLRDLWRPLV